MENRFVRGRATMALRCRLIFAAMTATALHHVWACWQQMIWSLVLTPNLTASSNPNTVVRSKR